MCTQIVMACAKTIAEKKWHIAFAESATAGRMCSEFALTPSSGQVLRGGICCYEVFVKEQILHVPKFLIEKYTPESAEVTEALAKSAAELFGANITVAVTGLTEPGGSETEQKPVGTMFLHIIIDGKALAHREVFLGSPESIVLQAIDRAAALILEKINNL